MYNPSEVTDKLQPTVNPGRRITRDAIPSGEEVFCAVGNGIKFSAYTEIALTTRVG